MAEEFPGPSDKAVLLRHLLRLTGESLHVPTPLIEEARLELGMSSVRVVDLGSGVSHLEGDPWHSERLASCVSPTVFDARFEPRRHFEAVEPDSVLLRWTRFRHYFSRAQKAAVQAILTCPPGATILVSIPTGGGKSLCGQLPALQASRSGKTAGGTVLVIVPTVSLALDQELAAQAMFGRDAVAAIHADTSPGQRDAVLARLRTGDLAMLFASPELALCAAREPLLDAARAGRLNWLVLDEAHIVESWGRRFRPHFQRLGHLRKALLEAGPDLRTLLLSATITAAGEALLRQLFAPGDTEYRRVDGSQLRTEHDFVTVRCDDDADRVEFVIEAVRHVPRPALAYVTEVEDAKNLHAELYRRGFWRSDVFTGKTKSADRKRIVQAWRDDRLDLVVGTSAFGLGIDKADVRAVIHACLPESPHRLYQEVGRGGRDGHPCVSILATTRGDSASARKNAFGDVLTTEKVVARWLDMYEQSRRVDAEPGLWVVEVNLETRPTYLGEGISGDLNRSHNEGALLSLQRWELICPYRLEDTNGWRQIEVLRPDVLDDAEKLTPIVEKAREEEASRITLELEGVTSLASGRHRYCIQGIFAKVYGMDTPPPCGRCQWCWDEGYPVECGEPRPGLSPPWITGNGRPLARPLPKLVSPYNRLMIACPWSGEADGLPRSIKSLLADLAEDGIQQFVVPRALAQASAEALKKIVGNPGFVVARDALMDRPGVGVRASIERVPTAFLFVPADESGDEGQNAFLHVDREMAKAPRVYIHPPGFRLPLHGGQRFVDKVDGNAITCRRYEEEREK